MITLATAAINARVDAVRWLHGMDVPSPREGVDKNKHRSVRLGPVFRHVVLGLLRRGGLNHGYALMREFQRRAGRNTNARNFYCELARLAAEGLVRMVDADLARG
jgi:hypothetical protein